MNVQPKQQLQKRIFPYGITYDKSKGNYGTAVLSPIFTLSERFTTKKSDFVEVVGRSWNAGCTTKIAKIAIVICVEEI